MTNHEIEEEMESLNCMLIVIDQKIHDLLKVHVRTEDKYAAIRKEIDARRERITIS